MPMRRKLPSRLRIVSALLIASAGCGGGTEPSPPPPPPPPPAPVVTTVAVTSPAPSVLIAETLQLAATVRDQNGAVMAGKTVTWNSSNPAVATVSASGLVLGLAAGSVTVTASVDGKSGSTSVSVVDPGPPVTLETATAATRTIGAAGGTISATSADGVTYDFIVPALALDDDISITMTPIASIRALPFSRGLVGGVEFQPSGLTFGPGARLVIKPPAAIPALGPNDRLIGFTYEGDLDSLRAQPAVSAPGGFAITIEHFSGGGLAVGNVSDLSALPLIPAGSVQQQRTGQLAPLVLPQDLSAAVAIFKAWRTQIEVTIGQAQTGVEAKIAVDLFVGWKNTLSSYSANFGTEGAALTAALAADQTALVTATQLAIKRGIAALNQQCLQLRSLLFAHNVLYLRGYADIFSSGLLTGIGSGLTETAQLATLCILPIQSFAQFPDPFQRNTNAALDLTYGVKFGSAPALDGAFFDVTLTVSGAASNGTSTIQTDAAGRIVQTQISAGTTPITLQVKSCLARSQLNSTADLRFLQDVCHFSTITANPQAALAITTSSLPSGTAGTSYNAALAATGGSSPYVWSISAGGVPAGLSLSASGTVSGTPTTAGTFNFTAQVVSGAESSQRALQIVITAPATGIPGTYSGTVTFVRNGITQPTPPINQTAFFSEVGSAIHGNICMGAACAVQFTMDGTLSGSSLVNGTVQFFDGCSVVTFPAQGTITSVGGVVTVNVVASGTECSAFQTTLTFALTRVGPPP
jgi:hypothetical protein